MSEAFPTVLKDQTGHVLIVDDEEKNRELLRDLLEGQGHQVTEAETGKQALQDVAENPPDVILLDVMMPGLDGFEVCRQLKADPETAPIPVLLVTALKERSDRLTGIEAGANDFISKPIDTQDVLLRVRNAVALQQHYKRIKQLEQQEQKLLEKTLHGAVNVMTDITGIVNPKAFSRVSRVRGYVRYIANQLGLPDVWEFELAAMLSQIGGVTLPPDLIMKVDAGKPLTSEEIKMYSECPKISSDLIKKIPRLEMIADIILAQREPKPFRKKGEDLNKVDRVALGGYILRTALEFDRLLGRDIPPTAILKRLPATVGNDVPEVFDALQDFQVEQAKKVIKEIRVVDLNRSMVFDEDVHATDGMLLVEKGQEATFPIIQRLRNYAKGIGVVQPFRVVQQK